MNIYNLKQSIEGDKDKVLFLLSEAGFQHIRYNPKKHQFRCAIDENSNPTAVVIDIGTLSSLIFSRGIKGDIITIIQYRNGWSFYQTLKFIKNKLKIDDSVLCDIELPFGGYYKKISTCDDIKDVELDPYDENILDEFMETPNLMFLKDNIQYETQLTYRLGYDIISQRITVPWRYTDGTLAGVMGRINQYDTEDMAKWLPVYPFPKSCCLFGFSENYSDILHHKKVIITESEKGVMQLDSMGIKYGLSNGGSYLSENQVDYIKALRPKEIIIAYDEGLTEEHLYRQAEKFKGTSIFTKTKIGYIYDKDNRYLAKGEKQSPTDLGFVLFDELRRSYVTWI